MFDIGWTEMLVIGVIAIVVVGPKDLPRMLRTVGQYVGKAKRMAREFQTQFDDAVKDTELDDVRKSFEDLKSSNPTGEIGDALSPFRDAASDLQNTMEAPSVDTDVANLTDETESSFADQAKASWDNSDAGKAAAKKQAEAEAASAGSAGKPAATGAGAAKSAAPKTPKPPAKKSTRKTPAKTAAKPAAKSATAKPKAPSRKTAKPAKKATANG